MARVSSSFDTYAYTFSDEARTSADFNLRLGKVTSDDPDLKILDLGMDYFTEDGEFLSHDVFQHVCDIFYSGARTMFASIAIHTMIGDDQCAISIGATEMMTRVAYYVPYGIGHDGEAEFFPHLMPAPRHAAIWGFLSTLRQYVILHG